MASNTAAVQFCLISQGSNELNFIVSVGDETEKKTISDELKKAQKARWITAEKKGKKKNKVASAFLYIEGTESFCVA